MMPSATLLTLLLLPCLTFFSCVSDPSDGPNTVVDSLDIFPQTEVPDTLKSKRSIEGLPKRLVFMPGLLLVSTVERPRAEIRSGPGHEYPLLDHMLDTRSLVVIYQQVGQWRKILSPTNQIQGWVHGAVLGKITLNTNRIALDSFLIPTVTLTKRINSVYDYDTLQPIAVKWSRGSMFLLLAENSLRKLVWLPKANGVFWINRGDAE